MPRSCFLFTRLHHHTGNTENKRFLKKSIKSAHNPIIILDRLLIKSL